MKNKIYNISLMALFIFFTGCFIDTDTATVRIKFGNVPVAHQFYKESLINKFLNLFSKPAYAQAAPAEIIRIHIAVFNGETAVTARSFDVADIPGDNTVELTVPAGENRTILVVGENASNLASYYGYASADLNAGETVNVTIQMNTVENVWIPYDTFNLYYDGFNNIVYWPASAGKARYHLNEVYFNPPPDDIPVYDGYGLETVVDGYNYNLYIEFEVFGIKTGPINLNFG